MIPKNFLDTNKNKIYSTPGKKYHAIKTENGNVFYNAIRTRNVWNDLRGNFLAYDQYVTDIQKEYKCPNCGREELLWNSAFSIDNEYLISCDFCKELTFLMPKTEKDITYNRVAMFIDQLDQNENLFRYWYDDLHIGISLLDKILSRYEVKYHRQKGICELYLWDKLVHSIPNMPEEESIINLVYLTINDWLLSERDQLSIYFENKI